MGDDLTVLGSDAISRSYDEHYGTVMDVEQDPTGAHHAIQRQHDRIEELETHLKNMSMLWAKADVEKQALLGRIEELEAKLAKAVVMGPLI